MKDKDSFSKGYQMVGNIKVEWVFGSEYPDWTMDPQDGGEPFIYWWEDMRRREVVELIREVYGRGMKRGFEHKK